MMMESEQKRPRWRSLEESQAPTLELLFGTRPGMQDQGLLHVDLACSLILL